MSDDDENGVSLDFNDVSKILNKYKVAIKLIGLISVMMGFVLYGYAMYHGGRFDECLEHNGYYLLKEDFNGYLPTKGDFGCVDNETLLDKGYIIDYENQVLTNAPPVRYEKGLWKLS